MYTKGNLISRWAVGITGVMEHLEHNHVKMSRFGGQESILLQLLTNFSKPPNTLKISAPPPPPTSYPLLYIKWTFGKSNPKQKDYEQCLKQVQVCFWLLSIDKTSHNTSFQHTGTTLSLQNQISTSTTTSLQRLTSLLVHKVIIFCYFILNSTRNKFHWLTNYSHYLANLRPI